MEDQSCACASVLHTSVSNLPSAYTIQKYIQDEKEQG